MILDAESVRLSGSQRRGAWSTATPRCSHHVIARCCRLKADVVEHDEREETGLRAVLNYGHTFAHAFESLTGYGKLLHGEAVAIGMICAARLAERLGRVDARSPSGSSDCCESWTARRRCPSWIPESSGGHDARQKGAARPLHFVLPSAWATWSWSATSRPLISLRC